MIKLYSTNKNTLNEQFIYWYNQKHHTMYILIQSETPHNVYTDTIRNTTQWYTEQEQRKLPSKVQLVVRWSMWVTLCISTWRKWYWDGLCWESYQRGLFLQWLSNFNSIGNYLGNSDYFFTILKHIHKIHIIVHD